MKGKKLETYAKVYLDKEKKFKTNRIKNSSDPTWSEDPRLLYVTTCDNHSASDVGGDGGGGGIRGW